MARTAPASAPVTRAAASAAAGATWLAAERRCATMAMLVASAAARSITTRSRGSPIQVAGAPAATDAMLGDPVACVPATKAAPSQTTGRRRTQAVIEVMRAPSHARAGPTPGGAADQA